MVHLPFYLPCFLGKEFKMARRNLVIVIVVLLMNTFLAAFIWAPSTLAPDTPPPICYVSFTNPSRSGDNVVGTGAIWCEDPQPKLIVVVQVADWTGRTTTPSATKTCYNTNVCSTTASLSYSPARQWQTRVSGYANNDFSEYVASNWISIP